MKNYKLYNNFNITFETPDDGYSYFFGYYDKSPINKKGDKLLAHRVSFDGRPVCNNDMAEVGYFDLNTNIFHKIDETLAWNWQQGSHLQWLPPKFDEKIIYNSINDNKFVSIIYDFEKQEKTIIPFPIYIIHPNGKEALCVNYERLYWCRPGYNYQNIQNKKWNVPIHPEDGIFKINLKSGKIELIVKTEQVVRLAPKDELFQNNNWLEHMMYNPSGDRFMFLHRWNSDGIDHTRLFTANSDGSDLFMYPDVRFYSHSHWKNDKELTIWTKEPRKASEKRNTEFINSMIKITPLRIILKPFYKAFIPNTMKDKIFPQSKLVTFQDKTFSYHVIGSSNLSGNGHITYSKDKKLLLNDTYGDEKNFRHLMLYDLNKNSIIKIGRFYSKYNSCGHRADLHPRFSLNDEFIIIDSAHLDKRKILILHAEEDLK